MVDSEIAVETMLARDRLLRPIPGSCPSGTSLRNTEDYDKLQKSLRSPDTAPGGVWQREQKKTDYRSTIRDASDLLATRSKDLDIAVWLTDALVREYGLPGLSEGILLIQRLLDGYWETVFPQLDDADEGFRAKPIRRLNTAFSGALRQLPITFDGRTSYEYNTSVVVPTRKKIEEARNSSELKKKRDQAIDDGAIPPEDMQLSVEATTLQFYESMAEDVQHATNAVELLQKTCSERFGREDRPELGKLIEDLERVRLTVKAIYDSKDAEQPGVSPVEVPPMQAPPLVEFVESPPVVAVQAPQMAVPPLQEAEALPVHQPPSEPNSIFALASGLRVEDPSSPIPYLLVRSWQFGPLMKNGSVDENTLVPPNTELKTALRRALLRSDWPEVLRHTEQAMEAACGPCWLDIQHYSSAACQNLGYEGAANAIRGLTASYLKCLPELTYAVMLDGSPTATADTLAWIQTAVLPETERARTESLNEVRPVDLDCAPEGKEPDAFEVAENELRADRFSEAFRILSEAMTREQSGRGRIQRKIQLAKICMEGGRNRIALAFLQEICGIIDERRLEAWEAPDFTAPPMAMLYKCFEQLGEGADQRRAIYDKLCVVDPVRALGLEGHR
jgi:type VI secretion system protein ImpA